MQAGESFQALFTSFDTRYEPLRTSFESDWKSPEKRPVWNRPDGLADDKKGKLTAFKMLRFAGFATSWHNATTPGKKRCSSSCPH